jgi:hypothetical protein
VRDDPRISIPMCYAAFNDIIGASLVHLAQAARNVRRKLSA